LILNIDKESFHLILNGDEQRAKNISQFDENTLYITVTTGAGA